MRRLMLLALATSTAVAMVGAATPAAAGQTGKGTECVLQHVDERGQVRGTSTVREGAVLGEFRCVGGAWQYSWAPFGPEDFVTVPQLQVNPAGAVSAREFKRPARSRDLTLGETADIARAMSGSKAVVFTRMVVAVDDGKQRTPAELEALLAGRDTTGARVLRTVDRPDPAMTVQDIVDEIGGQEPVVVYFLSEIWNAIMDALIWVDEVLGDIGEWIDENCVWFPPPPPGSNDIPIIHCGLYGEQW